MLAIFIMNFTLLYADTKRNGHLISAICKQRRGKLKTELLALPPLKSPSLSNLDFSATAHEKEELALPSLVRDSSACTEITIDFSSQHSFLPKISADCSEVCGLVIVFLVFFYDIVQNK